MSTATRSSASQACKAVRFANIVGAKKFHGHGRWIELRHLSILGCCVYITKSPHTKAYNHHLMLQLIGSTVEDVSRKEDVGYDAFEGAIKRCISTTVNWDEFDELSIIGIDEIALSKGRKNFIAIVTTQQADGHVAVLAVLPDRKKEDGQAISGYHSRTLVANNGNGLHRYVGEVRQRGQGIYCNPSSSFHRCRGGSLPRNQELARVCC